MTPGALAGPDARLAVAPAATYRALLALPWRPASAAVRPVLILVALATSVSLAATRTVSAPVLLSTMFWWSMVPLVQVGFAALLVASAPRRVTNALHAVDLALAGHLPWSLWLLAVSLVSALSGYGALRSAIIAFSIPLVLCWRAALLYHFCRIVLACDRRSALVRTVLHQLAVWALFLAFVSWSIGLRARLS